VTANLDSAHEFSLALGHQEIFPFAVKRPQRLAKHQRRQRGGVVLGCRPDSNHHRHPFRPYPLWGHGVVRSDEISVVKRPTSVELQCT
jgi:hypothetical protein